MNIHKVREFLRDKEEREQQRKSAVIREVTEKLKSAEDVFEKHGVDRARLYGSFANGRITGHSDVDVAVEGNIDFSGILRLHRELSDRIKRTVDVRLLDELPFVEKITKNGIIIYERETGAPEK